MLYVVGLIGVVAFAASGVLSAARRGMDLIGITSIALVTAKHLRTRSPFR